TEMYSCAPISALLRCSPTRVRTSASRAEIPAVAVCLDTRSILPHRSRRRQRHGYVAGPVARSVLGTDVGPARPGDAPTSSANPAQEVTMSHQAHFAQAIAEQRQADLVVAAAHYRLARLAPTAAPPPAPPPHSRRVRLPRPAARRRGTTPLRPRGRRAGRQLVGWFSRQ